MEEIWKDIQGYEGLYQVSNLGRVKSLNYNHTGKEKLRIIRKDKYGYMYVILYKNKTYKHFTIHRLVANAFIDNPKNLPQINHIDENKENNCVNNLEWCTSKYNINYGMCHKNTEKAHYKKIFCVDKITGLITCFESIVQASEKLSIKPQSISDCLRGKQKSYGGFYWYYG